MAFNYPSVTEVLSVYMDFSKVPPGRLEAAVARGISVHSICAAKAKKIFSLKADENCRGYVESFDRWFELMVKEVLFVEEEFVDHELGFVGHPDLGVVLRDGLRAIVDLKTPVALQGVWQGQLAGYLRLTRKKFKIEKGGSLRLDPQGGMAKMKWYEERAADEAAFVSALMAYKYFKN